MRFTMTLSKKKSIDKFLPMNTSVLNVSVKISPHQRQLFNVKKRKERKGAIAEELE